MPLVNEYNMVVLVRIRYDQGFDKESMNDNSVTFIAIIILINFL